MSQQNPNGNGNGGGGGNVQRSGPDVITSPNSDTRTLNHRGTEVGSSNVSRSQNTANTNTEVLSWTVPQVYQEMVLAGGKHITKGEIRTKETFSGDGSTTTFSLSSDVVAVAGETDVSEQPYPAVVAYDNDASSQLTVDSIDYSADEVTFASAPNDDTDDNVEVWPVFAGGTVQYRGKDGFGNQVGPLDEWGVPTHVFADFDQEKNMTQIHMVGSGRFIEGEELVLYMDAPQQIVWTDSNYPEGDYVSRIEQRVDVVL